MRSYTYSVVIEQSGRLIVNDRPVEVPPEGLQGESAPLGWALDTVREGYRGIYAQHPESELTLSVRDHRPGGLERRARFVHPDQGIDLGSFLQRRPVLPVPHQQPSAEATAPTAAVEPERAPQGSSLPAADAPEVEDGSAVAGPEDGGQEGGTPEHAPTGSAAAAVPAGDAVDTAPTASSPPPRQESPAQAPSTMAGSARPMQARGPAVPPMPSGSPEPSARRYDEESRPVWRAVDGQVRPSEVEQPSAPTVHHDAEPDGGDATSFVHAGAWVKTPPEAITRPQIRSAENKGRSKKSGLAHEKRRQRRLAWIGGVVALIVLVVALRMFMGGETYEAICVDQRTMTRASSGVACEDDSETNYRWWYVSSDFTLPEPGSTVQEDEGTFRSPGGNGVVNKHVEADDETHAA